MFSLTLPTWLAFVMEQFAKLFLQQTFKKANATLSSSAGLFHSLSSTIVVTLGHGHVLLCWQCTQLLANLGLVSKNLLHSPAVPGSSGGSLVAPRMRSLLLRH